MIRLSGVTYRYRRGPVVLQNFTAEFPPGITVILGPNGSGKTTLLKIIAGMLKPQSGAVEIMGKPPEELRGKIAYIPQAGGLYPWMTVRENIALPLKLQRRPNPERETESVAESLGISHLLDRYPKEISGGEQQKTLIARALVSGAEVWLLDEPLSMIDIDYRREIIQLLKKVGRSMVVITHNMQDAVDLGGYVYIVKGPPLQLVATAAPGQYTDAERLAETAREVFRS